MMPELIQKQDTRCEITAQTIETLVKCPQLRIRRVSGPERFEFAPNRVNTIRR